MSEPYAVFNGVQTGRAEDIKRHMMETLDNMEEYIKWLESYIKKMEAQIREQEQTIKKLREAAYRVKPEIEM